LSKFFFEIKLFFVIGKATQFFERTTQTEAKKQFHNNYKILIKENIVSSARAKPNTFSNILQS
jgi:hypothetical protein